MASGSRRYKITEEELERKRDEYNKLIIKENELLEAYPKAPRLNRMFVAKRLQNVALQLAKLQSIIDNHSLIP